MYSSNLVRTDSSRKSLGLSSMIVEEDSKGNCRSLVSQKIRHIDGWQESERSRLAIRNHCPSLISP